MIEYEFHPAASVFPLIKGKEFADLAADIKTYGLLNEPSCAPPPPAAPIQVSLFAAAGKKAGIEHVGSTIPLAIRKLK